MVLCFAVLCCVLLGHTRIFRTLYFQGPVFSGQRAWRTAGRGTDGAPDTHNLNKDGYGPEAGAVLIQTLETRDRIKVDLPYVLVRRGQGEIEGVEQRKDVLYSPHDVSLSDNVLAVVSQYPRYSWDFGSLSIVSGKPESFFGPRPDGSATLDYVIRDQGVINARSGERQIVDGNSSGRDAFLFDGTPSTKALAPAFTYFDSDQGDRLLFTGDDDATIYWQVKFISEDSNVRDYELVFYDSNQIVDNNVLAVFEVRAIRDSDREWSAGPEIANFNAEMFLDLNKPALVNIPTEHKYYVSGSGRLELNDEMQGTQFVTDYFSSIPYSNREAIVREYNAAAPGHMNKNNKVPVIKGFEDGRDKIFLEPGHARTIWWREETVLENPRYPLDSETMKVIALYNVETPTSASHKIAVIEKFDGTFSHEDFISVDPVAPGFPYIDILPDLIIELPSLLPDVS